MSANSNYKWLFAFSIIVQILRIILQYVSYVIISFVIAQILSVLGLVFFVIAIIRFFSDLKNGKSSVLLWLIAVLSFVFGFLPALSQLGF